MNNSKVHHIGALDYVSFDTPTLERILYNGIDCDAFGKFAASKELKARGEIEILANAANDRNAQRLTRAAAIRFINGFSQKEHRNAERWIKPGAKMEDES
jgi:hypothetical protein